MFKLYKAPFEETIKRLNQTKQGGNPHLITGLDASAKAILIAQMYRDSPSIYLIIEPDQRAFSKLIADLDRLLPDVPVLSFDVEESLAVEYADSSANTIAERVETLNFLTSGQHGIVISSVQGIMKRLNPVNEWQSMSTVLTIGSEWEREKLERQLQTLGYQREAMVTTPGEYSVRGGIVDFFPFTSENPIRLDFFDIELDSIRLFNPETQVSIKNLTEVVLDPVVDIIFTQQEQCSVIDKIKGDGLLAINQIQDESIRNQANKGLLNQISLVENGDTLKYASAYMSYRLQGTATLVDYLPPEGWLIINEFDKIVQTQHRIVEENTFWIEQEVAKGNIIPKLDIKASAIDAIETALHRKVYFSIIQRGLTSVRFQDIRNFQYRSMNNFFNHISLIVEEIKLWFNQKSMIQILLTSKRDIVQLQRDLEDQDIQAIILEEKDEPVLGAVNIVKGTLEHGFELPQERWVVLTENELFNKVHRSSRRIRRNNLSNAERIKSYNELNIGDYVVHLDHGIGRYTGLETMEINGIHRDLLAIEYRDAARVLIPVDKIDLIQKYIGSESITPRLHRLGGTTWAKTKQRVQSSVEDIADELIELYAQREEEVGYAFSPDTAEQVEFEAAFPYVETPDQLTSSHEIKKDMERSRPMDRLLVGDVGYGKTEVAMRAIFKAVMDGKQVAFLVPTTILAQQHYNSLIERFNDWPFEIRMLSRFVSLSQQRETIEGLKNGSISIVVGTHRLLSKDVIFHDLGLLIIDEEQRFGVKHKERLKQIKAHVDVLTLTATPIPRTLHMSMIGVRDLSVIETPPENRFPVQTYVMEYNVGAIKMGIERELARGGQVFYLYNRVDSIYEKANAIQALVPDARIAVAHGQMQERELEAVLIDFIQGEFDVLVTTTIIETGVDIPNANTIFIDQADRMGLSTLYQLRGRVGRTHRVAYAYLMYDPYKQLSEVSEKRLFAIREFTDLGSGFKIAMRDLSIRGAGNLLGQQQSGFIDSIGYELYTQMLQEAVERRRGEDKTRTLMRSHELEWDIDINAYIPTSYIEDEKQKLQVYSQIQQIDSQEAYRELQDDLIDRFGEFPDEVSDLLSIALIRYYSMRVGIINIQKIRQSVMITFNEMASKTLKGPTIFKALQDVPLKAEIKLERKHLVVNLNIYRKESYEWLAYLLTFTQAIDEILTSNEYLNEEE